MECIHDNGSEFVGIEFQEMLQSYGIKSGPTTVRNPQSNAIIERSHQVIANCKHAPYTKS
jgi:transposase InsO family protein